MEQISRPFLKRIVPQPSDTYAHTIQGNREGEKEGKKKERIKGR